MYKSLSSFDPRKGAFTTWLHRITLNFCLNHRRRRLPSSLEDVSQILVSEFPGEQLAESESILRAMNALSDKQQAVIFLRYYWDLPYAEIASILEIPLGTVKSRLDLAIKTMRNALEDQKNFSSSRIQVEVCE